MVNGMKKGILIFSLILLVNIGALAQGNGCDCDIAFTDMIQKLEGNYIGLALNHNAGHRTEYEKRKIEFRNKAINIQAENCTKFLQHFLSFFQDEHLFVTEFPKYSDEVLTMNKVKVKENKRKVESILRTLEDERSIVEYNGLEGIMGKWTDGQSDFAIIKEEGYYRAYVLSSKSDGVEPGELKAEFKATDSGFEGTYYTYKYSLRFVQGTIYKEGTLLVLTGAIYWGKLGPASNREISMINRNEVNLPTVKQLDEETTLLSIPSFLVDFQKFNNVLVEYMDVLKNTTNLIIDIRGNVGGNAIYFGLVSAYATQPLKGSQGLVLASEETKAYFKNLAKNSPQVYDPVLERMEKNKGQVVEGPQYPDRQFPPFESSIKHVAILTDNGCKSAAESFILHSKGASHKVTTFGSATGGVIDYTSINSLRLESGDQNIYFGYPTSTLHKEIPEKGYNKTGIIPDVPIEASEKDKIGYIMEYYKKLNNSQ
jgi:hypothetical protein